MGCLQYKPVNLKLQLFEGSFRTPGYRQLGPYSWRHGPKERVQGKNRPKDGNIRNSIFPRFNENIFRGVGYMKSGKPFKLLHCDVTIFRRRSYRR